jgi:hypothetical protein
MAVLDWPADAAFVPRAVGFSAITPKSGFQSFFTGQMQTVSHLADRLRLALTLPPCEPLAAGAREAFFMALASSGDLVRLGQLVRPEPEGTLRGAPTVHTTTAAGARTLPVQTTAGATVLPGDVLGSAGQLLIAAYPGATADGAGLLQMPLVLPLRAALASGTGVGWQAPTTPMQLLSDQVSFNYGRGRWQGVVELLFAEVF